jgi:hypothetical protein
MRFATVVLLLTLNLIVAVTAFAVVDRLDGLNARFYAALYLAIQRERGL